MPTMEFRFSRRRMIQGVGSATLAQSVATISAAPALRTWPIVEGPDTPKICLAPGDGGAPLAAVMQPQAAETAPGRGGRGGGYGGFLPPKAEAAPVAPAAAPGGRIAIVDKALRHVFPDAPPQIAPGFQKISWQRAPMGIGRPRLALSRLRVRTPKRTITPLSVDEVARFWSSFRTSRDLAIVGLMLLQGLRSKEVLDLNQDDLLLSEAQIRVSGKGNKTRFLPLAPEAAQLLDHYLRLERPANSSTALFVSLKGSARGARMTPAGLRSLFRHHRQTSGVKIANPHRFRHTFASDMHRKKRVG